MSKLITPTPGRVVWYWPSQAEIDAKSITVIDQSQPLAATVAHVWHDRMVNLSVVDQAGAQFRRTSVQLLQQGDERPRTSEGPFAEWMPYQLGQAAKAAEPVTAEQVTGIGGTPVVETVAGAAASVGLQDGALDPSNDALAAEAAKQVGTTPVASKKSKAKA